MAKKYGLARNEKLKSVVKIDALFTGGRPVWVYPLSVYYRIYNDGDGAPCKMLVSVGAKEETVNGPRFNESIASMIKKATKGEKLVIQADVMMPDGKPKSVTYTATLR